MNHWPFILTAYGLTFAASAAIALASWISMRRAEAAADRLTRR